MAATTPNEGLLAILKTLTLGTGVFNMRLYQNRIDWSAGIVLGGVVEGTFSGYVAVPLVFPNPPSISLAGLGQMVANLATFIVGAGGVTNLIYGYFVTYDDGSNHSLVFGEQLPTAPLSMASPGDTITLTTTIQDAAA